MVNTAVVRGRVRVGGEYLLLVESRVKLHWRYNVDKHVIAIGLSKLLFVKKDFKFIKRLNISE